MSEKVLDLFQDLRASLITGAMILVTLYLWIGSSWFVQLNPSEDLSAVGSVIAPVGATWLAAIAAYLVGSTYLTGVETLVDKVHQAWLTFLIKQDPPRFANRLSTFHPFSDRAKERLIARAQTVHSEKKATASPAVETFVSSVLRDVLWMEGKIVGTDLHDLYGDIRREGEFRLGVALLVLPFSITVGSGLGLSNVAWWALVATAILTTPMLFVQGFYQYRKSNSLLAHHVADGKVLTPSMESLQRDSQTPDAASS